jgi:hypothetical protein
MYEVFSYVTYKRNWKIENEMAALFCANLFLVLELCKLVIRSRVARWLIFKTENPNFGKIWRVLLRKMLVHFMAIWYIFPHFGMLYQEKSGNPGKIG